MPARTEIFIQTLPFTCKKVVIDNTVYYQGENNTFLPVEGGYILVDNAESYDEDIALNFVKELPAGSKRVIYDGKLYWFGADTWFEPVNGGYVIINEPYRR